MIFAQPSKDYSFLYKWGCDGNGQGQFLSTLAGGKFNLLGLAKNAIAIDPSGNVYVLDTGNARIQKFTSDGKFLGMWGPLIGSLYGGIRSRIADIAVDSEGQIYAADPVSHNIRKYDGDGKLIAMWGSHGLDPFLTKGIQEVLYDSDGTTLNQQLQLPKILNVTSKEYSDYYPALVAADNKGYVYAINWTIALGANTSYTENLIRKFTSDGKLLTEFGPSGFGEGKLFRPTELSTDPVGNIYVIDHTFLRDPVPLFKKQTEYMKNKTSFSEISKISEAIDNMSTIQIKKFTGDGKFLGMWGSIGSQEGQLNGTTSIAIDPSGNVFVADTGNARIQKFTSDGKYLGKWGTAGLGEEQFIYPTGVTTSPTSDSVYVYDTGSASIKVFSPSASSKNMNINHDAENCLGNLTFYKIAPGDEHRIVDFKVQANGTYVIENNTPFGNLSVDDNIAFKGPGNAPEISAGSIREISGYANGTNANVTVSGVDYPIQSQQYVGRIIGLWPYDSQN